MDGERVFAIDPGSSQRSTCGWAWWNGSELQSGIWDLTIAGPDPAAKCDRFAKLVTHACTKPSPLPTLLAIEQPGIMQNNLRSVEILHGLVMFARVISLRTIDRKVRLVHPMSLKKATTTKGNANKQEMVAAVRSKHPEIDIRDDNQADAIAIVDMILAEEGGPGGPNDLFAPSLPRTRGRRAP